MDITANAETFAASPFLPRDRRWAIRFGSGGTVTLVLGMKDYGRGWFSGYFAGLVAARLGVPFHRVRLYYSGTLPAVLQKPAPSAVEVHREHIGPVANAAADTIERLCDLVIENRHAARGPACTVPPRCIGFLPGNVSKWRWNMGGDNE